MKYPGPWTSEQHGIGCMHIDANGVEVAYAEYKCDEAERLFGAAFEMLEALKRHAEMGVLDPAAIELIDRIEKYDATTIESSEDKALFMAMVAEVQSSLERCRTIIDRIKKGSP